MIKIIDNSGRYFTHRSWSNELEYKHSCSYFAKLNHINNKHIECFDFINEYKPIIPKYRFNKFELLTLFSFENYDNEYEQIYINIHHEKDDDGVSTPLNFHVKILPHIKLLLINILNITYLIKNQKYKRNVRHKIYNEIKHINLLLSINFEYKIYDKIHYFTQYPFYEILFDWLIDEYPKDQLLYSNNSYYTNETEFEYKTMELIIKMIKNMNLKRGNFKYNEVSLVSF